MHTLSGGVGTLLIVLSACYSYPALMSAPT
jgi:hypothetical protein